MKFFFSRLSCLFLEIVVWWCGGMEEIKELRLHCADGNAIRGMA